MNSIQRMDRTGWFTYVGKRAAALLVAGGIGAGIVAAGVAGGLWLMGPTAENALETPAAVGGAQPYPQTPQTAAGAQISSQAIPWNGRRADDTAIGYTTAEEAAANCKGSEYPEANWRGGWSCTIDMDAVREQQTGIRLIVVAPPGPTEE